MKKRWLSLALAILMVFALIPQAALPVLAEEEITLDQIEAEIPTDQVNEKVPADETKKSSSSKMGSRRIKSTKG